MHTTNKKRANCSNVQQKVVVFIYEEVIMFKLKSNTDENHLLRLESNIVQHFSIGSRFLPI